MLASNIILYHLHFICLPLHFIFFLLTHNYVSFTHYFCSPPEPARKPPREILPRWRRPVTAVEIANAIQFERTERKEVSRLPSHAHWPGRLVVMLWLGAFGFYLYRRIHHTMNRHSNIFAYQVCQLWGLYRVFIQIEPFFVHSILSFDKFDFSRDSIN